MATTKSQANILHVVRKRLISLGLVAFFGTASALALVIAVVCALFAILAVYLPPAWAAAATAAILALGSGILALLVSVVAREKPSYQVAPRIVEALLEEFTVQDVMKFGFSALKAGFARWASNRRTRRDSRSI